MKKLSLITALLLSLSFPLFSIGKDVTVQCHPPYKIRIYQAMAFEDTPQQYCWEVYYDGYYHNYCSKDNPATVKGKAFTSSMLHSDYIGFGRGEGTVITCKYHNLFNNRVGTTSFIVNGNCLELGNNSYSCSTNP